MSKIKSDMSAGTKKKFHSSLDSLANSSVPSESLSDDSNESDSSGADIKSKNSFSVQCEVYAQNSCGSIRSWTKSESGRDSNSECSYESIFNDGGRFDMVVSRMETIPEEICNVEPKVSVKEILARFENLRDKDNVKEFKDSNNNISSLSNNHNNNHNNNNSTTTTTTKITNSIENKEVNF